MTLEFLVKLLKIRSLGEHVFKVMGRNIFQLSFSEGLKCQAKELRL